MRRRNSASLAMPAYAVRDTASVSWAYFVLTVVCACVLAAGFFFAARQHFNSMEYGFKNGQLRKQVEDLQTEKRRLMLVREVSMSPAEIKRSAKNLGFRDRGEVAVMTAAKVAPAATPSSSHTGDTIASNLSIGPVGKAIKASFTEPNPKTSSDDKTVKKTVMQKARNDSDENKPTTGTR